MHKLMNPNTKYEFIAGAFYRDTGLMAPGKDDPFGGSESDFMERQKAWDNWQKKNEKIIKSFVFSAEQIFED